jgi:uncharacterized protein YndB with AHSA1/START domain
MSQYLIEHEIEIDAPIEVVWRTVTDPSQMCQWFSEKVEFESVPGASGTLTFPEREDGTRLVVEITIVAIEQPHHFSYRWLYPAGEEATTHNSVLVTFTLTSLSSDQTVLHVSETGLELMEMPEGEKHSYVESHNDGWRSCGERLTAFITSGSASAP